MFPKIDLHSLQIIPLPGKTQEKYLIPRQIVYDAETGFLIIVVVSSSWEALTSDDTEDILDCYLITSVCERLF